MDGTAFSPLAGIALICAYGLGSFGLVWLLTSNRRNTKAQFLVADRELGLMAAAMSIAATWIWAPALFLSASKAYEQGLAGVFWFTVPNVACLIVFGFFADRIRRLAPEGFTLSDYMREQYSRRVQGLYLLQLGSLAACSFAVQLLAGGKVIAALTGFPLELVTVVLAGIALAYSMLGGLRASVITDYLQMAVILAVSLLVVPWAVSAAGGWEVVERGLGGLSGEYRSLVGGRGLQVAYSFGIPVTIGLLAGPFGDQSFWQRAFSIQREHVRKAFFAGAIVFAVVPLTLAVLGFLAAGKGWEDVADPALVNLDAVARLLPPWVMVPMVLMLLSGLGSTLDSNLCAVSCLSGHDMIGQKNRKGLRCDAEENVVRVARFSMIVLAVVGLAIANIPGMEILYLFLFYGTLRASTLIPTVATLIRPNHSEAAVFYGILAAIFLGLPLFACGNFAKHASWTVTGAIATVSLPGVFLVLSTVFRSGKV